MPNRMKPTTGKRLRLCAATAVVLILVAWSPAPAWSQTAASPSPSPTGVWLVSKQYARIRIVDCGNKLWGVVVWEVRPGVDSRNPDPNLRSRPTLGMPVLLGMTQTSANQWDGQIYNSQDGHTYSASISLVNPDTLRVKGCFLGILCGSEEWTRVEPPQASQAQSQNAPRSRSRTQKSPSPRAQAQKSPPNRRNPASGQQPENADAVCLRILGPARFPHERRLK